MTIDWRALSMKDADRLGAIRVNVRSKQNLMDDLSARLVRGEGFSIATLNLDHVVKLRHDPAFAAAYAAHSHVTADGNPIVWLLRLAGHRVALVPGSELVDPVARLVARHGVPVGLFGATAEALDGAGAALQELAPDIRIVVRIAPPMGFDPDGPRARQLIDELHASGARVVFLALGAPKQEILAARLQSAFPDLGILSIGAGLDFLAGTQRRAPATMRALALEWLWRLLHDPARLWRRYMGCIVILPGLTAGALRMRRMRER